MYKKRNILYLQFPTSEFILKTLVVVDINLSFICLYFNLIILIYSINHYTLNFRTLII